MSDRYFYVDPDKLMNWILHRWDYRKWHASGRSVEEFTAAVTDHRLKNGRGGSGDPSKTPRTGIVKRALGGEHGLHKSSFLDIVHVAGCEPADIERPDPADADPPDAPVPTAHGVSDPLVQSGEPPSAALAAGPAPEHAPEAPWTDGDGGAVAAPPAPRRKSWGTERDSSATNAAQAPGPTPSAFDACRFLVSVWPTADRRGLPCPGLRLDARHVLTFQAPLPVGADSGAFFVRAAGDSGPALEARLHQRHNELNAAVLRLDTAADVAVRGVELARAGSDVSG